MIFLSVNNKIVISYFHCKNSNLGRTPIKANLVFALHKINFEILKSMTITDDHTDCVMSDF